MRSQVPFSAEEFLVKYHHKQPLLLSLLFLFPLLLSLLLFAFPWILLFKTHEIIASPQEKKKKRKGKKGQFIKLGKS